MSERLVLTWIEGKGEHWVPADELNPPLNPACQDHSGGDNPAPDWDDWHHAD